MASGSTKSISVRIGEDQSVSGLLNVPPKARACYVLAHGAGAGIRHPFMANVADGLSQLGIATLRYQFPYMERGSKRPDAPEIAHAAVRAAVAEAPRALPGIALFAGGKSFGGRMTSQAQAKSSLPNVQGIAFLGFPLHTAGRPSDERGQHLMDVQIPMLFLQGSRDKLADLKHLKPLAENLGPRATLRIFEDADHSFHVPARTGPKDAEVMAEVLDTLSDWIDTVTSR